MEAIIWICGIFLIVSSVAITADHYRTKLKDLKYEYQLELRDSFDTGWRVGARSALNDPMKTRQILKEKTHIHSV